MFTDEFREQFDALKGERVSGEEEIIWSNEENVRLHEEARLFTNKVLQALKLKISSYLSQEVKGKLITSFFISFQIFKDGTISLMYDCDLEFFDNSRKIYKFSSLTHHTKKSSKEIICIIWKCIVSSISSDHSLLTKESDFEGAPYFEIGCTF